jgi:hypothetical protein
MKPLSGAGFFYRAPLFFAECSAHYPRKLTAARDCRPCRWPLAAGEILTKMKKDKIIYWTATGIVVAIMLWSAFNFSFNKEMKGAFAHLGLPNWFRIELTVAKILGALALLIPAIPNRIKEFAYCGFAITLISAPLLFLGILIVSYFYYYKAQLHRQPAAGLRS